MLKHLTICTALLALAALVGRATAHGAVVIGPPVTVSGPQFDPTYAVGNLFDGLVTDADVDVTSYGTTDAQWAGPGIGPHEIFMDFGTSITANGVAYSQRSGDIETADKVGTIEFWFSNDDFMGAFPDGAPDATADITILDNQILASYGLGGVFSGQYVAARFIAPPDGTFNPGGSEMRLLAPIPEPSTILMLSLAGVVGAVAMKRSRETDSTTI